MRWTARSGTPESEAGSTVNSLGWFFDGMSSNLHPSLMLLSSAFMQPAEKCMFVLLFACFLYERIGQTSYPTVLLSV